MIMTMLILAQATQPAIDYDAWRLSPAGWVIMLLSVGFVTGLISWCTYRIMRESTPDKVHSQLDIEPKDVAE